MLNAITSASSDSFDWHLRTVHTLISSTLLNLIFTTLSIPHPQDQDAAKMAGLCRRGSYGWSRRFLPCSISPRPAWRALMHRARSVPPGIRWVYDWNEIQPWKKMGRLCGLFIYERRKEQATKYKVCSLYLPRSAFVSQMISHRFGIINRDENNRIWPEELKTTCDFEQLQFLRTIHVVTPRANQALTTIKIPPISPGPSRFIGRVMVG
jgi:hypothetical protein